MTSLIPRHTVSRGAHAEVPRPAPPPPAPTCRRGPGRSPLPWSGSAGRRCGGPLPPWPRSRRRSSPRTPASRTTPWPRPRVCGAWTDVEPRRGDFPRSHRHRMRGIASYAPYVWPSRAGTCGERNTLVSAGAGADRRKAPAARPTRNRTQTVRPTRSRIQTFAYSRKPRPVLRPRHPAATRCSSSGSGARPGSRNSRCSTRSMASDTSSPTTSSSSKGPIG